MLDQMTPRVPFKSKLIHNISIATSHKQSKKGKTSLKTPYPVTAASNAAPIPTNPAVIPALMQQGLQNFE